MGEETGNGNNTRRWGEKSFIGNLIYKFAVVILPTIAAVFLYAGKVTLERVDDHITVVDNKVSDLKEEVKNSFKDIKTDEADINTLKITSGQHEIRLNFLEQMFGKKK